MEVVMEATKQAPLHCKDLRKWWCNNANTDMRTDTRSNSKIKAITGANYEASIGIHVATAQQQQQQQQQQNNNNNNNNNNKNSFNYHNNHNNHYINSNYSTNPA